MTATKTGGCLCGAIRYEASGEPLFSLRCHCRDCQRQSGGGYIAAMRLPISGFRITKGMPKRYRGRADSGNEIARVFCGECGAPLYVQVSTRPDLIGLRVSSLDDPSGFRADADIFCRSAQPWDPLDPATPHYDTYPEGHAYPPPLR